LHQWDRGARAGVPHQGRAAAELPDHDPDRDGLPALRGAGHLPRDRVQRVGRVPAVVDLADALRSRRARPRWRAGVAPGFRPHRRPPHARSGAAGYDLTDAHLAVAPATPPTTSPTP